MVRAAEAALLPEKAAASLPALQKSPELGVIAGFTCPR